MGKLPQEMVDDYADKLLIGLNEEENKMVLEEFDIIDKNIDLINDIPNIKEVGPMTHPLDDFVCELREDIAEESIPREELLQNCDDSADGEVEVPRMVG